MDNFPKKINSYYIKTVLMEFYRYQCQCLCAAEVDNSDIIILKKNNLIHEIEIKCNQSDLCHLEIKKEKHLNMTKPSSPHYFSFCVTPNLVNHAKQIIDSLNPKYGLIEIDNPVYYHSVHIIKPAKKLHNNLEYTDWWKHKITYRLNSALIQYMRKAHKNEQSN